MADKSFGVKELNLISASGTPTITSPNSVNINATNVAISTDITVGGMVSLGAGTSISSLGSNVLTFGTNSTEKVRINSAGSLGIGTDNPRNNAKLDVHNSTASGVYINYDGKSNTEYGLRIESNADGGNFESDFANGTTALLDLYANSSTVTGGDLLVARTQSSTPVLLVRGNGNIGIGTDNPTKALHLAQNSDIAIRMDSNNANANARTWEIVVGGNPSNNAEMVFRTRQDDGTGGSECARIKRNGIIALPSGGGIDFSATSDATGMSSELLDDYEEGTWTPTINFGGSFNGTYAVNEGFYTKIGRLVNVSCELAISSKGSTTGQVNIDGLPFTPNSDDESRASGVVGYHQDVSNIDMPIQILIERNQTIFPLRDSGSVSSTGISDSNLGNGFRFYFTVTYMT